MAKPFHIDRKNSLSFLPSFLACVQSVCCCFAATGSTSPLSQDGLCRFYFFSVIPQTHFLTGITKINDDFWFLNKKTKQIQLSGSNLTESSVFLPLCSLVCVKSLLDINQANNQPSTKDLFPANFYVPEVILTLGGREKIVRLTCSTNSVKVNSLSPHNLHIFLLFLLSLFLHFLMQSSFKNLFIAVRFSLKGEGCNASAEEGGFVA